MTASSVCLEAEVCMTPFRNSTGYSNSYWLNIIYWERKLIRVIILAKASTWFNGSSSNTTFWVREKQPKKISEQYRKKWSHCNKICFLNFQEMHIYRFEHIPERAPSGERVLRLPRRKECTKKGRCAAAWPGLQKYVKAIFFRKTFEIELWYWIMIYVALFTAKVHVSIGRIVSEEFRKKGMTRNAFIFKGAGQKCFGRILNTIEGCRLKPLRNNLQKSLVCLASVSRFASSFQTKLCWSWWSDYRFYPIHVNNLSHCKKNEKENGEKNWDNIFGEG